MNTLRGREQFPIETGSLDPNGDPLPVNGRFIYLVDVEESLFVFDLYRGSCTKYQLPNDLHVHFTCIFEITPDFVVFGSDCSQKVNFYLAHLNHSDRSVSIVRQLLELTASSGYQSRCLRRPELIVVQCPARDEIAMFKATVHVVNVLTGSVRRMEFPLPRYFHFFTMPWAHNEHLYFFEKDGRTRNLVPSVVRLTLEGPKSGAFTLIPMNTGQYGFPKLVFVDGPNDWEEKWPSWAAKICFGGRIYALVEHGHAPRTQQQLGIWDCVSGVWRALRLEVNGLLINWDQMEAFDITEQGKMVVMVREMPVPIDTNNNSWQQQQSEQKFTRRILCFEVEVRSLETLALESLVSSYPAMRGLDSSTLRRHVGLPPRIVDHLLNN